MQENFKPLIKAICYHEASAVEMTAWGVVNQKEAHQVAWKKSRIPCREPVENVEGS